MARDGVLKCGVKTLAVIEQEECPTFTLEDRVRFAIYCAWPTGEEPWRTWARAWLDGSDRSRASASSAASATGWAASAAGWAARAAYVAEEAKEEWESAQWAAKAAEWMSRKAEAMGWSAVAARTLIYAAENCRRDDWQAVLQGLPK